MASSMSVRRGVKAINRAFSASGDKEDYEPRRCPGVALGWYGPDFQSGKRGGGLRGGLGAEITEGRTFAPWGVVVEHRLAQKVLRSGLISGSKNQTHEHSDF